MRALRSYLLGRELGHQKPAPSHPGGHYEAPGHGAKRQSSDKGQPGLTGPQRDREEEGEGAANAGSPERSGQFTYTHCF